MAKKRGTPEEEETQRGQSRQDRRARLLERRQAQQVRQLRLAVYGVLGLIGLTLLGAVIVEFLVVPNQAVAEVNGERITLRNWQRQVRYQRAQLISGIDQQYESFVGEDHESDEAREAAEVDALRFVQQFAGQQINLLTFGYETLGEFVLDQMVEDTLIRQEAAARGIVVADSEVDEEIGARYNYFGGDSPTPFPTATTGPEPTPSITPIGFIPEPEAEPTEVLPTNTPQPSPTPVSLESFNEQLDEELDNLRSAGADVAFYDELAASVLYRERVAEAIFASSETPTEVPHVTAFTLSFDDRAVAESQLALIRGSSYLDIWNQIRNPIDPTVAPVGRANEFLWQTQDSYATIFPDALPEVLFTIDIGQVSEVVVDSDTNTGLPVFIIAQVTGREDRALSEFEIQQMQQEMLNEWLTERISSNVTTFDNWRGRVPRQPALDTFYRNPAPTPEPQPTPEPVFVPTVESSGEGE